MPAGADLPAWIRLPDWVQPTAAVPGGQVRAHTRQRRVRRLPSVHARVLLQRIGPVGAVGPMRARVLLPERVHVGHGRHVPIRQLLPGCGTCPRAMFAGNLPEHHRIVILLAVPARYVLRTLIGIGHRLNARRQGFAARRQVWPATCRASLGISAPGRRYRQRTRALPGGTPHPHS